MTPTFEDKERGVQLYLGDCLAILPTLTGIDAVVTDPPYGVPVMVNSAFGLRGGKVKKDGTNWGEIKGNNHQFDPGPWLSYPEVILWGANHFAHRLKENGRWLVWDKRCGIIPERTQADCEMAWCKGYGAARLFRFLWDGICQDEKKGKRLHPTEKPETVMAWCITFIQAKTVLDPYMGSGTTGIACLRTGRRFIGIEIDPTYYKIAEDRIKRELAQGVLL